MLTKFLFKILYNSAKNNGVKHFKNGNFVNALDVFREITYNAYSINLFYCDNEIENIIDEISKEWVRRKGVLDNTNNVKVVFYDSFGWDNRGLTQQYIRALINSNIPFLYIFENYNESSSIDIVNEINLYNNAIIYKMDTNIDIKQRISKVVTLIEDYHPTHSFLHLNPNNIDGLLIWNRFKEVKRFLINLTDHAFWLGKKAMDYSIEFRNYGYNISKNYRNIPKEKIVKLFYYPIINDHQEFKGYPVHDKENVIITSGSSYYKVFGENDKFFKLIQKIYAKNKNIVLFFAGSGDNKKMQQLIDKYGLNNVFVPIGERRDIYKVIQNSDIYLSTYPWSGGLMSQFAIVSKIPSIAYSDISLSHNFVEGPSNECITISDEEQFLKEINKMIANKTYRINKAEKAHNIVITVEDFNTSFKNLIYDKYNQEFIEQKIDTDRLTNVYLDLQNNYTPSVIYNFYNNRKLLFKNQVLINMLIYLILILTKIKSKFF